MFLPHIFVTFFDPFCLKSQVNILNPHWPCRHMCWGRKRTNNLQNCPYYGLILYTFTTFSRQWFLNMSSNHWHIDWPLTQSAM